MHVDHTQRLYFFFDVFGMTLQIRLVGKKFFYSSSLLAMKTCFITAFVTKKSPTIAFGTKNYPTVTLVTKKYVSYLTISFAIIKKYVLQ